MEIKPVKHIEKPKYPQKQEIDIEAVKRSLPKRWASSPAAKIALGTLAVVSLAGCVPDAPTGSPAPDFTITEGTISPEETYYQTAGVPIAPIVNVAPLFIHGEGRGTYGCDMVTSPAFLSEEEALTVINEVAKEYGLEFSDKDKAEFSTVLRPVTHFGDPGASATAPPDVFITLKTDFSDNKHGVAMEFVSVEDVKSWCKDSSGLMDEYDTKGAAAQLSEALENAGPKGIYTAGVLYDPCGLYQPEDPSVRADLEEFLAKSREMSEEQLKAQARDFFEWLKAQGII